MFNLEKKLTECQYMVKDEIAKLVKSFGFCTSFEDVSFAVGYFDKDELSVMLTDSIKRYLLEDEWTHGKISLLFDIDIYSYGTFVKEYNHGRKTINETLRYGATVERIRLLVLMIAVQKKFGSQSNNRPFGF